MYRPDFGSMFPRDVKRCKKKHWDLELLDAALAAVVASDETPLPHSYNDHALRGDKKGYRLLHINGRASNWILLYKALEDTALFVRTGTHDEIL
ncbi:MAG: type II toxin-antitoxin system YafQ family toxin [Coriobacteriales bacterium]|jgi:mRNA interferase YafQ|nr:type II toxin-antitoxin system YafQ family toxin [Coriobacteriales bacterium]